MALKCKKCGGDVATTEANCPKCGQSARSFFLTNVVQVLVIFFIIPGLFIWWRESGQSDDGSAPAARASTRSADAKQVELRTLLKEYADNEVRADASFKDKLIQTSGVIGEVKKDIVGDTYVLVGTSKRLALPALQCTLDSAQKKKAATLTKGARVTSRGRVKGLMMNVQAGDCELVEL